MKKHCRRCKKEMPPISGYTGYEREGFCFSCLKDYNEEKRLATERKCSKCHKVKTASHDMNLSAFNWQKKGYSWQGQCKECQKDNRRRKKNAKEKPNTKFGSYEYLAEQLLSKGA